MELPVYASAPHASALAPKASPAASGGRLLGVLHIALSARAMLRAAARDAAARSGRRSPSRC